MHNLHPLEFFEALSRWNFKFKSVIVVRVPLVVRTLSAILFSRAFLLLKDLFCVFHINEHWKLGTILQTIEIKLCFIAKI